MPKLPTHMHFQRVLKLDPSAPQLQKQQLDDDYFQVEEACDIALSAAVLANEHCNHEEYGASQAHCHASKVDRDEALSQLESLHDVSLHSISHSGQVYGVGWHLPATNASQVDKATAVRTLAGLTQSTRSIPTIGSYIRHD
jgi:hypothetical protein